MAQFPQSDPMEPGGGGGPYDIEEINTENADHTSLSGMNNLNHQNSTDNQNNMSSYSGNPFTPDFMRQNSNPNSNVVVKAEARELENGNSNGQYGSNSLSHQNMMDSAAKICIVCHDRASGKHYGVYSCEGCKGFFKRTVRKNLKYTCRDERACIIDKRQRNRCQFCRYSKCLDAGMKKEAVQDERKRPQNEDEFENPLDEMPVIDILEAEKEYALNGEPFHLRHVKWASRIPHFKRLNFHDQKILIKAAFTELLILNYAFHPKASETEEQKLILSRYLTSDVVDKIQEIQLDETERGSLKAIILLNPDSRGLHYPERVLQIREKLYASLEAYCKSTFPDRKGRFARILLRLPALRSIGLEAEIDARVDASQLDSVPDSYLQEILSSREDVSSHSNSHPVDHPSSSQVVIPNSHPMASQMAIQNSVGSRPIDSNSNQMPETPSSTSSFFSGFSKPNFSF